MSAALRNNPAPVPSSCDECGILAKCGGWDDDRRKIGCFQKCAECFDEPCDYTCPANAVLFAKSIDEVGGFGKLPVRVRPPGEECVSLPTYIPQIEHGGKRQRVLKEPVVSVPLNRLCRFNRYGRLEILFRSSDRLLDQLKLSQRTGIIVTCVTKDLWIEGLYEERRRLLPLLKALNPIAVTVPNFSFVRDSPRPNSIWNQTRGFRMIEDMSDAGLAVIPHLQAQTAGDWRRLEELFTRFPYLLHACMEFQTGLHSEDPAYPMREIYKRHFQALQDAAGGRIHPIVLGGYREIGFFSEICRSFSIIDANVFVKTANYQEAYVIPGARRRWKKADLAKSQDQAFLLESNIAIERDFLFRKHGLTSDGRPINPVLSPAA